MPGNWANRRRPWSGSCAITPWLPNRRQRCWFPAAAAATRRPYWPITAAGQRHGAARPELRWLQADLFDAAALAAAGLKPGSLDGVVEHTCFCAIDPSQREAYRDTVMRLLRPGGWLLGLFFCHNREGGPPYGSNPDELAQQWAESGLIQLLWEPAQGSVEQRSDEWLGLFRKPDAANTTLATH